MHASSLLLQAMDGYASRITANVTWNSDIGRGFLKLFFTKVLQYHVVTGRCGADVPGCQVSLDTSLGLNTLFTPSSVTCSV
jgi:hypothetical protein